MAYPDFMTYAGHIELDGREAEEAFEAAVEECRDDIGADTLALIAIGKALGCDVECITDNYGGWGDGSFECDDILAEALPSVASAMKHVRERIGQ